MEISSIDSLQNALRAQMYIADRGLATAVFLALRLNRPLLLEGEAGVGKTEVAKVLAHLCRRVYEWLHLLRPDGQATPQRWRRPGGQ